ncbi:MAG TPA: hypothetical protein VFR63_12480 [Gaiellaceae bacterium]|nr:hypothetical protein [Gaiellaceae bacterium]
MAAPSGALEAGLAAVAVALGLMWLGFGLTGLVPSWRGDPVIRWAFAFPAIVVLALVMMGIQAASGGAFFASAAAVRVTTGLVAAALALRWVVRRWRSSSRRSETGKDLWLAVVCSVLVAVLWGTPVFRMLPLTTGGDAALHAGWTEQLLNGETTPSSPLTGDVPNYYPWLHHALLGLLTHLTPGGHAFLGLAPLQVLQALGLAAALFALGRLFAGAWAGAATALLGAAAGGFGFALVRGLDLVVDPRAEGGASATQYAGDLLYVRSYNVSFANLPPPFPRDVALALFVAALVAMSRAAASGRLPDHVLAGVVLGLVGLTQLDPFLVGLLAALGVVLLERRGRRLLTGLALLGPALALFSLWALPVAVSYVRYGGFVDTTVAEPVVLPVWAVLGGWGIVTPLAAVGAFRAARSRGRPVVRVLAAALAAGAFMVATSALIPTLLGEGFESVGRQHRYWPLLALPLAILAGFGAHALACRLRRRSTAAAAAAAGCVVALSLPSPLIASLALPAEIDVSPSITRALTDGREDVLDALARYGEGACSAAVPRSAESFAYTGFHFLRYGQPLVRENAARIRWAEIYEHIVPEEQRLRDEELLMSGSLSAAELGEIADRYDLDVVVVPRGKARADGFAGLRGRRIRDQRRQYVLYGLDRC